MPTCIVVFAKAPLAGFAKTRLIPALGAAGAADLARRMLAHTLRTARQAGLGPLELCVTPSGDDPAWRTLGLPEGLIWSDQGSGDLGARMARAARRAGERGESVLLIGTDCPALGVRRLRDAARALASHDAALIPATDGGYVLLGLRRFDPAPFEGIAWGGADVANTTLDRLARLQWRVRCFPALHDIDEAADLAHLPAGWSEAPP